MQLKKENKKMTMMEVKAYEVEQYKKAFEIGTPEAWKKYRVNVKWAVNKFNREHEEKIDIDLLME